MRGNNPIKIPKTDLLITTRSGRIGVTFYGRTPEETPTPPKPTDYQRTAEAGEVPHHNPRHETQAQEELAEVVAPDSLRACVRPDSVHPSKQRVESFAPESVSVLLKGLTSLVEIRIFCEYPQK